MNIQQPTWANAEHPSLPGRYIQRLMRRHHLTIRDLAKRMNITMKRVRTVRDEGIKGRCMCLDWYEAITQTGIFTTKGAQMANTNTVEVFSGYIVLEGNRVQVDFQTQLNATPAEQDASFLAALAQKAEIDYLSLGTTSA